MLLRLDSDLSALAEGNAMLRARQKLQKLLRTHQSCKANIGPAVQRPAMRGPAESSAGHFLWPAMCELRLSQVQCKAVVMESQLTGSHKSLMLHLSWRP